MGRDSSRDRSRDWNRGRDRRSRSRSPRRDRRDSREPPRLDEFGREIRGADGRGGGGGGYERGGHREERWGHRESSRGEAEEFLGGLHDGDGEWDRDEREPPRKKSKTAAAPPPPPAAAAPGAVAADDAGIDPEEAEMMALMGFGGFGSTQGKQVDDPNSNASAVHKKTTRRARQYMNRPGGFNRPLPDERTGVKSNKI
mmetsp:Transcript_13300/g.56196  ORF Transcript_13300/g.56196 Transcript_13300/m.56196 type:complete len:199 (+) Transcript_13300:288-884(+)